MNAMPPVADTGPSLTIQQVLQSEELKAKLLESAQRRFQASAEYMRPYHDKWVRFYKLYRSIADAAEDPDEPNTGVCYAYRLVEDMVSKISEPLLQMKPPCRVAPRRAAHEKQAERFAGMAASYFRTSRYQLEYTDSVRELAILGNAWEQDCWFDERQNGRIWQKVQRNTLVDKARSILGKVLPAFETPYESMEEVDHATPIRVGYGTRFPSPFRIYPEPNIPSVRDMHWLIEEEPAVAIADLKKRMCVDPATGQPRPFFDFTELEAANIGRAGTLQPEPMGREKASAEDELRTSVAGEAKADPNTALIDDIDRVNLVWVWEPNRVWVIAQGRFVVAYQERVFQSPRIPYRLKVYTPQKGFLFGLGCIEPVENQLHELNDIHRLSMRNWVRIINRMVAYNEDAIPYDDDFTPSALGRVRVRPTPGHSVAEEIVALNHSDVTPSMLTQESNTKGIVEAATASADFAPGAEGTKQTHKTLGGLMEISRSVAQRITTVRRMLLAAYQDQMWFMEKLESQFLLEKTPFTVYGPDGATVNEEFDLWDIYTEGQGFDFIIEHDPAFGDDQLRRNQMMALQGLCFEYTTQVKALRLREAALPDVEEIFREVLQSFGWSDTSQIMKRPNGILSPDEELQIMLAGQPVAPNIRENLIEHVAEHQAQEMALQQAAASGKVDPRALFLLQAHREATQQLAAQILANPAPLVAQIMQEKVGPGPGAGAAGAAPRLPVPGAPSGAPAVSPGSAGPSAAAGMSI